MPENAHEQERNEAEEFIFEICQNLVQRRKDILVKAARIPKNSILDGLGADIVIFAKNSWGFFVQVKSVKEKLLDHYLGKENNGGRKNGRLHIYAVYPPRNFGHLRNGELTQAQRKTGREIEREIEISFKNISQTPYERHRKEVDKLAA